MVWINIVEELGANLFALGPFAKAFKKLAGRINMPLENIMIVIEKGRLRYCVDKNEFRKMQGQLFDSYRNKKFFEKAVRLNNTDVGALKNFADKITGKDFSKLDNKQLAAIYQEYSQLYVQAMGAGMFFALMDLDEPILSNYLEKSLQPRKASLSRSTAEFFAVLTTPTTESLAREEEKEFLKIAAKVFADKKLMNLFLNGTQAIEQELQQHYRAIWHDLQNHAKKYGFISFGYDGPGWDESYFITALSEMVSRGIQPKQREKEIEEERKRLLENQKEFLDELDDKELDYWFKVARETMYLKNWRKEILFYALSVLEPAQNEVAKRLKLPVRGVKFMLPLEIAEALDGREFYELNKESILERFHRVIYYCMPGASDRIVVGKEATMLSSQIKGEEFEEGLAEIKGTPAYFGIARGKVVHINSPEDLKKMHEGAVLVSIATNPDLVPAMKKAAAIVTDMGGVTCHAAIVSRELKIPCIVGTKIATRVLKEGDLVEVDAKHGVVRRIE